MYASKKRGRDRHTVFTADLREQFTPADEVKLTLRRTLDQEERRSQPIVFEALLRPEQRDGTQITAVELGYLVMREACAQARRRQDTDGKPTVTTVNVSAKQLTEPAFVFAVKRIVREAKLDPHLLGIEVTESVLIRDVESSLAIMNELLAFGIKFYLEDFETGYSSLSYLKNARSIAFKRSTAHLRAESMTA